MKAKKIAAIDIGSNAARLLISNVYKSDNALIFKKADIIRVPIRLGTQAFVERQINKATIQRLVDAMQAYHYLMKVHGVTVYRGCATSAMREAKNAKEIIHEIKRKSNIQIEIISGKEEAQIIYSTHIERLLDSNKKYLYVDVGGGSTEVTLFDKGKVAASKSFNIGTIRILNDMISTPKWDELHHWITDQIQTNSNIDLIGSGGNINKVFKLSLKEEKAPLTYNYIWKYYKQLKSYTFEERILELGLNPDRADVIIPALKIFTKIMKWAKAEKIYVPKIGLADGIVRKLAKQQSV